MSDSFKNNLKSVAIALGIFLFLSLAYTYPSLEGNVLSQHDNVSWQGMSKEAKDFYDKTGESPLWTNSMFGGMPTYTHYLAGVPQANYAIQEFIQSILPKPAYFLFFAMVGFFILLSSMKVNRWIAIIGAIAYAFGSYNVQIIAAGHDTKMLSIAFMPIAFAGMISLYRGKYLAGGLMALTGLAFTIQNGMYQIDYYLIIVMFLLGIGFLMKAIQSGELKKFSLATVILIGCGILSILPSLMYVSLTKEYGNLTMRGGQSELTITNKDKKANGGLDKDYAFQWSQGVGEVFTLFVPNLYGGGGSTGLYWGSQPFVAGPFYFGILTMLLLVLGLLIIQNRMKWALFAIGIFGILLSLGDNFSSFNYLLFDHLPMYNSFRTPSMSMVIPGLTFTIIAFWALHAFLSDEMDAKGRWDALKKSVIITGGLVFLLGIGGSVLMDFKGDNDEELKGQIAQQYKQQGANQMQIQQGVQSAYENIVSERSDAARTDGLRSLFFLVLGGLILWMFTKEKLDKSKAVLLIGVLFVLDLTLLDWRYLNGDNYMDQETYSAQFLPRPVDLDVKKDTDPYYRVFDLSRNVYNDAMQAYHHKCIGGYHPAKMESYQDLIDVHLTPGKKLNQQVLNMLNTKYIIFNAGNQPVSQPNPGACGNAWFVRHIKKVNSADEEMLALDAPQIGDTATMVNPFQPLETAVVRNTELGNEPISFVKSDSAFIKLTEYSLNHLYFESSNPEDGFAVFSDIYYNLGWTATIDNKEAEIIKTNYLLRGLFIPKGNHTIKFVFMPNTYTKYRPLTMYSSYLILLLILGGVVLLVKDGMKKENKTS